MPSESEKKEAPDKWRHRRRIAYVSLWTLLGLLVFLLLGAVFGSGKMFARISSVEMLLSTITLGLVGLVGGYMGTATMSEIKLGNRE